MGKSKLFDDKLEAVAFAQACRAMAMYTQAVRQRTEAEAKAAAAEQQQLDFFRASEQAREQALEQASEEEERRQQVVRESVNFVGDTAKLNGILSAYRSGDIVLRQHVQQQYDRAIGLHLGEHIKIDFAALPIDGRMMFLAVYLGLQVGKDFPRVDFERSDPATNSYVYNTRYGPADAIPWRQRIALINRYLGGSWSAAELDGTSIRLWRLPALPEVIPMMPDLLRRGDIFMGFDVTTGVPYYIPLAKMTHTLVGGQSGVGKSVLLNQCLRSMLYNLDLIDELILVDLKRVELSRYDGLSPKIKVVRTYEELPAVVARVMSKMHTRLEALERQGELSVKSGFTIIVIDEFASIEQQVVNGKEEAAAKKALTANLVRLSQLGRAAGIRLWAQLQKPTADNMDTSFRTNLQSVSCFYMPSKVNATQMFGDLSGLPIDPTELRRGEFIFQDDGQNRMVHLKSAICDEYDIDGLRDVLHPDHRTATSNRSEDA